MWPNGKALGLGPRFRGFDSLHSDQQRLFDRKNKAAWVTVRFMLTMEGIMDVFIIHSGCDKAKIDDIVFSIQKTAFSFNALVLKNGGRFWKYGAKKKIKKAQMIVFFVGQTSHLSKNIDWEIQTAIRLKKPIYTIKLDESYAINRCLQTVNAFSGESEYYSTDITLEGIEKVIKDYDSGNYKVFNQSIDSLDKDVLLEQYKLFLQTSEDLVSRRQNANNFYISVNSALMGVWGMIWALDMLPMYKFFIGLLLSMVGVILSVSWTKLLSSYGNLNGSKMKIISYIEKQLPVSLYDAEWEALSDRLNKKKYVSFTDSEKRIPILFIAVYICALICSITFMF